MPWRWTAALALLVAACGGSESTGYYGSHDAGQDGVAGGGGNAGTGGSSAAGGGAGIGSGGTAASSGSGGTAGMGGGAGGTVGCVNSLDCPTDSVCDPSRQICVDCVIDADCDAGVCRGNRCVPPCASDKECTPLGLLCGPGGYCVECVIDTDCGASEACRDDACVSLVCQPGAERCVDNAVERCSSLGDGWAVAEQCLQNSSCVESATGAECGPFLCGTAECSLVDVFGFVQLPPCCPDTAPEACGLDVTEVSGSIGLLPGCYELDAPGSLNSSCPDRTMSAQGYTMTFSGCCRPEGECGYLTDLRPLIEVNLGCTGYSALADAGAPQSCTP